MEANPENWRTVVGRNAPHYLRHFERVERSAGRWVPGWNWAAFLHSTAWFCYRRMYAWAIVNFFAPFLLFAAAVAAIGSQLDPRGNLDGAFSMAALIYLAAVFIAIPVFADSLYYRSLRRHADKALPPSIWTSIGALSLAVVWSSLFIAISMPGYCDYTPRAKVSEGLIIAGSLKTAVAEFHERHGRLPGPDEAKQFAVREPSVNVASANWDPARNAIIVTMASDGLKGRRFEIAAQADIATLSWTCRTIDMAQKHLPASCRDQTASSGSKYVRHASCSKSRFPFTRAPDQDARRAS